jgi:hypothetical protein
VEPRTHVLSEYTIEKTLKEMERRLADPNESSMRPGDIVKRYRDMQEEVRHVIGICRELLDAVKLRHSPVWVIPADSGVKSGE